jgi:isoleucyl-tRNA synthetase
VTSDTGTGIVHCAPAFGMEDYKVCLKNKLIQPDNPPMPLDENGRFLAPVKDYLGIYVKDADN